MVNFTTIFFIILSLIMMGYILLSFQKGKRNHILKEIFFLTIYGIFLLIILFPNLLNLIEEILGIQSAINFGIYLSIFLLFAIVFMLYKKSEEQRVHITKLNRELTYLKHEKKKK